MHLGVGAMQVAIAASIKMFLRYALWEYNYTSLYNSASLAKL